MSDVTDEPRTDRDRLTRAVRQRLESLRRAGIDRIPSPPVLTAVARPVTSQPVAPAPRPEPEAPAAKITPPPQEPPRPPRPAAVPTPALPAASLFGEQEIENPAVPPGERPARLEELRAEVAACTKCPLLASTRTQTVFGVGSPAARLMFIGEAPGADEDRTGVPFVGKAGQLLTDMITKGMGMTREDVYIANILKSRPPENRNPLPEEIVNCRPFLDRQIGIVRPEFLCVLGKVAASTLLETALPLGKLRGRWHRYRGIPAVVTYHPAFLLRTPSFKKDAWDDLQMLMKAMGLKPPARGGKG